MIHEGLRGGIGTPKHSDEFQISASKTAPWLAINRAVLRRPMPYFIADRFTQDRSRSLKKVLTYAPTARSVGKDRSSPTKQRTIRHSSHQRRHIYGAHEPHESPEKALLGGN